MDKEDFNQWKEHQVTRQVNQFFQSKIKDILQYHTDALLNETVISDIEQIQNMERVAMYKEMIDLSYEDIEGDEIYDMPNQAGVG